MPHKRVLIVDDSLELGRVLRAALETLNTPLTVRMVPSAEEGLLDLKRSPVELLISDVRLPGMTGFELVRKVRALPSAAQTRIMIISGWTEYGLEEQAHAAQADIFLRKPLNMADFLEKSSELLGLQKPSPLPAAVPELERRLQTAQLDSLSGVLAGLRHELGAQAAVLLNGRGRLKAQAGELPPGDFEEQWSSALTGALGAGARVSRLLGDRQQELLPSSALAFKGIHYDLLLAPVGDFALALFLKHERGVLRLPLAVEVIFNAQRELAHILTEMGINLSGPGSLPATGPLPELPPEVQSSPPAAPEPVREPEMSVQEVAEFEQLLKSGQPAPLQGLDAFWEQAAESTAPDYSNPGVLNYEQARRLGLTPEEGEGK